MDKMNYEEMFYKEIVKIISRRKGLILNIILACFIISAIIFFIPGKEVKKEYEAVSSFSIIYNYNAPDNPETITEGYLYYQDRLQNTMIPTINGYSKSLSLLRSVINELEIKDDDGKYIKAKQLAKNIKIENISSTNLITVSVTYEDDKMAELIANKIPEKLIQMSIANEDLSNYEINIVDYAISSELEKKESSKVVVLLIGILSGVIVGIFLAFSISYFNKNIQSIRHLKTMGYDIERIIKDENDIKWIKKIISSSILSNATDVLIGIEDESYLSLLQNAENVFKEANINLKIEIYIEDNFIINANKADRTFIIVKEDSSKIEYLYEVAKYANRYNIKVEVIYFEN